MCKTTKSKKGICLMECMLGGSILIVVALLMLDLLALVVVHNSQDRVTYYAARMAADADSNGAPAAAQTVLDHAKQGGNLITKMTLSGLKYIPNDRVEVTVDTQMKVLAPLPGMPSNVSFQTTAIEPVVATPIVRL